MQLTRALPRTRRERAPHARPEPAPGSNVAHAQARAKRSGGPEDVALYTCECGYAFKAEVTTSVGCPECGTHQAW
jgi:DNA-directed RNA polymerase subunit M/transcription elongation factor TFIIS